MTAPVLLAAQAVEVAVLVTFDQSVVSSTGAPGAGWSVTINGVPAGILAATQPLTTQVRLALDTTVRVGDLLTVSYDAAKGNLRDVTTVFPVASILAGAVTNSSACAGLLAAVLALTPDPATTLSLVFSAPVLSVAYLTGLTVNVNGVPVAPLSAGPGADPRTLKVVFAALIEPTDALTFSYDSTLGDWNSAGYVLPSFVEIAVSNAANQPQQYPLSTVIREPLEACSGDIEATIGIDLCYVDNALLGRYGPARVDFGGTFGITVANPAGILIPQDFKALNSGIQISKMFCAPGNPAWAQVAAEDWLNQISIRIGTALGILRATDKEVVLGSLSIVQV